MKRIPLRKPDGVLFAVAAVLVTLGFALYTGQIWEDYFITFRHSQNLCEGKGLVYNEGERVHGFTSPLGVLLPALCHAVTGGSSYAPALWLFRALSVLAFAGAGVLLLQSLPDESPRHVQKIFLGALYLVEFKAVSFSMNGMETAFLLLFLAWGVYLAQKDVSRHWLATGACWAGLMWARPDGFAYIAVLAVVNVLHGWKDRKGAFLALLKSAAVCTALYLPWFGWAWAYYGSPVPHTVTAKSGMVGSAMQDWPHEMAAKFFLPVYFDLLPERWYPGMVKFATLLGIFCATYWLVPVRDRLGRAASLCFALLTLYFVAVQKGFHTYVYPWYMAPAAVLGLVVLVRGAFGLADAVAPWLPHARVFALLGLLVIWSERAYLFGLSVWQAKVHHEEVEMGNRAQIGLWLRGHVRPADTVYLEPLGYVGYFSGAKVRDWPGLVSPEVVRLRREKQLNFASVARELRPEWLVLRAEEVTWLETWLPESDFLRANYAPAAVFDVTPKLEQYAHIPGRRYVLRDAVYVVFKKKVP